MITNLRKNKYKNKEIIIDGIKFQSIKEGKRYNELKILKKAGLIKDLELQPVFELQPKYTNYKGEKIKAITYKADFMYYDTHLEKIIVEDVKGHKTDVYKLKKKLFEYKYTNLTIEEI